MGGGAIFLDRDGTLNVEKDYLFRYEDWEWIPGALQALKNFVNLGFRLVVVSNQSGISRGFYTEADVRRLHAQVAEDLHRQGVTVAGFYFCPHGPTDGCDCRKPRPGLIHRAQRDGGLDLSRSFLVGDKNSDLQAAQAAGVRPLLVETGYGTEEKKRLPEGVPSFKNLLIASEWMIREVS